MNQSKKMGIAGSTNSRFRAGKGRTFCKSKVRSSRSSIGLIGRLSPLWNRPCFELWAFCLSLSRAPPAAVPAGFEVLEVVSLSQTMSLRVSENPLTLCVACWVMNCLLTRSSDASSYTNFQIRRLVDFFLSISNTVYIFHRILKEYRPQSHAYKNTFKISKSIFYENIFRINF